VYEWIEMFENGCTSVTDAQRSGRPATATTKRNEERTLEMTREKRITVEEVAGRPNVGVGYDYSTIHDRPNFSKVCQVGAYGTDRA
jgi:transposase